MSLSAREIAELRKIVAIAQKLLAAAEEKPRTSRAGAARPAAKKNSRRRGKELIAFRKTIAAERKRGVPVAEIARKHGVTPNYVYQITG